MSVPPATILEGPRRMTDPTVVQRRHTAALVWLAETGRVDAVGIHPRTRAGASVVAAVLVHHARPGEELPAAYARLIGDDVPVPRCPASGEPIDECRHLERDETTDA